MVQNIHDLLTNISFKELEKQIDKFECKVSFFRGRKFYLEGYEGNVSFNKLIYTVYQKARGHAGAVNGHKLYENLKNLHEKGEKELVNQPFLTRVATVIKRAFTYLYRLFYLNLIYDLTGYSSLAYYCQNHKDKLIKEVNAGGITLLSDQLILIPKSDINYNNVTQSLIIKINIPHTSTPLHYTGLTQYQTEKTEDPAKLYDIHFENLTNELNLALPLWLESREHMDAIALGIRKHIKDILANWRSKKSVQIDCEIENVNINIETKYINPKETLLTYSCSIKFKKTGNHKDKNPELFLKKLASKNPNKDSMQAVSKGFISSIDDKIDDFLKNSIEKEAAFSSGAERIFFEFFGTDFKSYFKEKYAKSSVSKDDVEDAIKVMETLSGSLPILLSLLNDKKYKELEAALKKMWKKGALKLHPDKVAQNEESVKKAAENFNKFGEAYAKASKWVSEQLSAKKEDVTKKESKKQDAMPINALKL